jgi:very-short-patch-repair endonuclease
MGGGGPAAGAMGSMGLGGGGGAPPGGSPMEGGMPGIPGGQPAPGGEMGGMPGGGGMGGGEMGGAPMGGGAPGATASLLPPNFKIGKKGKGGKKLEEMMKPPQPKFLRMTKLEQKTLKILQGANIPNQLFAQFEVSLPGEKQPFVLDFAYPNLGVCVECNGKIWHENMEAKIRDQQRDQKLANIGWRILRFNEDAIQQQPEAVKAVIEEQVLLAKKEKMKKKSANKNLIKEASVFEGIKENELIYDGVELNNNLGYMFLIGT